MLGVNGPVGEYFAVNLRQAREARGLSQAELAQRIATLGHSCTQATVWKLEHGHREPKLSEAAAIGQALGLRQWTDLTVKPATFNLELTIEQCRQQVYESAERTRAAAAAQLEALVSLAFAVREAQDAGLPLTELHSGGWLDLTPEATVLGEALAARAAWAAADQHDDVMEAERNRLTAQIMHALENSGVPLAIHPEDIEIESPKAE